MVAGVSVPSFVHEIFRCLVNGVIRVLHCQIGRSLIIDDENRSFDVPPKKCCDLQCQPTKCIAAQRYLSDCPLRLEFRQPSANGCISVETSAVATN